MALVFSESYPSGPSSKWEARAVFGLIPALATASNDVCYLCCPVPLPRGRQGLCRAQDRARPRRRRRPRGQVRVRPGKSMPLRDAGRFFSPRAHIGGADRAAPGAHDARASRKSPRTVHLIRVSFESASFERGSRRPRAARASPRASLAVADRLFPHPASRVFSRRAARWSSPSR